MYTFTLRSNRTAHSLTLICNFQGLKKQLQEVFSEKANSKWHRFPLFWGITGLFWCSPTFIWREKYLYTRVAGGIRRAYLFLFRVPVYSGRKNRAGGFYGGLLRLSAASVGETMFFFLFNFGAENVQRSPNRVNDILCRILGIPYANNTII